jgi:hypothetical protein
MHNLESLPDNQPVIWTTTHNGSQDVPLAMAVLRGHREFVVADMSSHHDPRQEFGSWLITGLSGFDTLPVSWRFGESRSEQKMPTFNPADAESMVRVLGSGKDLLVAGYNPVIKNRDGVVIPPRPGYMAALVSNNSGAPIMPLAVDINGDPGAYHAVVHIGERFMPEGATIREPITATEGSKEDLARLRRGGRQIFEVLRGLQDTPDDYPFAERH